MADQRELGQRRLACVLRDLAERVDGLFPGEHDVVALETATAIEELRAILDTMAVVRAQLVFQERRLEDVLDGEAKRGGDA